MPKKLLVVACLLLLVLLTGFSYYLFFLQQKKLPLPSPFKLLPIEKPASKPKSFKDLIVNEDFEQDTGLFDKFLSQKETLPGWKVDKNAKASINKDTSFVISGKNSLLLEASQSAGIAQEITLPKDSLFKITVKVFSKKGGTKLKVTDTQGNIIGEATTSKTNEWENLEVVLIKPNPSPENKSAIRQSLGGIVKKVLAQEGEYQFTIQIEGTTDNNVFYLDDINVALTGGSGNTCDPNVATSCLFYEKCETTTAPPSCQYDPSWASNLTDEEALAIFNRLRLNADITIPYILPEGRLQRISTLFVGNGAAVSCSMFTFGSWCYVNPELYEKTSIKAVLKGFYPELSENEIDQLESRLRNLQLRHSPGAAFDGIMLALDIYSLPEFALRLPGAIRGLIGHGGRLLPRIRGLLPSSGNIHLTADSISSLKVLGRNQGGAVDLAQLTAQIIKTRPARIIRVGKSASRSRVSIPLWTIDDFSLGADITNAFKAKLSLATNELRQKVGFSPIDNNGGIEYFTHEMDLLNAEQFGGVFYRIENISINNISVIAYGIKRMVSNASHERIHSFLLNHPSIRGGLDGYITDTLVTRRGGLSLDQAEAFLEGIIELLTQRILTSIGIAPDYVAYNAQVQAIEPLLQIAGNDLNIFYNAIRDANFDYLLTKLGWSLDDLIRWIKGSVPQTMTRSATVIEGAGVALNTHPQVEQSTLTHNAYNLILALDENLTGNAFVTDENGLKAAFFHGGLTKLLSQSSYTIGVNDAEVEAREIMDNLIVEEVVLAEKSLPPIGSSISPSPDISVTPASSPTPTPLPQFSACGACSQDAWGGCTPPDECRLVNDYALCTQNNKPGTPCCLHDVSCQPGFQYDCGYADIQTYCNKCSRYQDSAPWCTNWQTGCGAGAPAKTRLKTPQDGAIITSFSPITFSWFAFGEGKAEKCGEKLPDNWAKWEDCTSDPERKWRWDSPAKCIPQTDNEATDRNCWGYVCARGSFEINPQERFYTLHVKEPDATEFREACKIGNIPNPASVGEGIPAEFTSCQYAPTKGGNYQWFLRAGYAISTGGGIYTNFTDSDTYSFTIPPCDFDVTALVKDETGNVLQDVPGFSWTNSLAGSGQFPSIGPLSIETHLRPLPNELRGQNVWVELSLPQAGWRIVNTFCEDEGEVLGCPQTSGGGIGRINNLSLNCNMNYTYGWIVKPYCTIEDLTCGEPSYSLLPLSWQVVNPVLGDKIRVFRDGSLIADDLPTSTTTYEDTGLSCHATSYEYKVYCIKGSQGEGRFTQCPIARCPTPTTGPSPTITPTLTLTLSPTPSPTSPVSPTPTVAISPTPTQEYCRLNSFGDANCDGDVDNDDLQLFISAYIDGVRAPGPNPSFDRTDFNRDGKIDLVDFNIWKEGRTGL